MTADVDFGNTIFHFFIALFIFLALVSFLSYRSFHNRGAYIEMLDTCRANLDMASTRDSLTIIENEPKCAEVLGK